ncbi:alpha/beta fold hydrolase [Sunxiuqinia indica]|uniref:alpha/beta fold hydrolase n=1 Tax=Sunxiuqinia indica TaxID=2692584 RepID=UPI00135B35DA|nr:alpha/beta hydrolase [Sunxiuqinia indica]
MKLARTMFGSGDKLLVLLHGNSLSQDIFSFLVKCIEPEFKVVLFDLPGHGDSPKPDNYNIQSFSRILAENINQIGERKYIIAHSLSGHLIIQALDQLPDVEGVVCIGTPPLGAIEDSLMAFPDLGKYMYKETWTPEELDLIVSSLSIENAPLVRRMLSRTDPLFRRSLESAGFLVGFESELKSLNQTTIPVTLLFSEDDPYLNPSYYRHLPEKLTNPLVNLHFLNWGGHAPFIKEPEQFWKLLLENCR